MINTIKYLTFILKLNINDLEGIIQNIDDYYLSWDKPKINKETGKALTDINGDIIKRQLNSTRRNLKTIQKRLYKFLLSKLDIPKYAFGGVPKRDNILNAKQHQGNKYIFTTDLKSFFPSISNKQVFDMFRENGVSPTVSRILTQITTYKHQLPQGVPTSTLIANIVFKKTGDKILSYAEANNIKFTIFVDDITLSSKEDFKDKIPEILSIIRKDGYKISNKKTFYKTKNPVITGVVCQNNKLKLQKSCYKRIKSLKLISNNKAIEQTYNGLLMYRNRVSSMNHIK